MDKDKEILNKQAELLTILRKNIFELRTYESGIKLVINYKGDTKLIKEWLVTGELK